MPCPRLIPVRQHFEATEIDDVPGEVRAQLAQAGVSRLVQPGESVAITCGSRGIAGLDVILGAVAAELKGLGAKPFVVPAMGSHGGGTAEGQAKVLASYGITEATLRMPIRSSMEVVEIGRSRYGFPVYLDKLASESDHIIVVNRIKPHTRFIGPVESGLMKMMLIGLGKHRGAQVYHSAIVDHPFEDIVRDVAQIVIAQAPITLGLAILENAYDRTTKLVALRPEEFETAEPELLQEALRLMAKLPFEEGDLLVVDEMGKEFSGLGMDPYVTGVKSNSPVHMTRMFVRDLTDKTYGNANGLGYADFTHRRLVDKIDYHAMYTNSITAAKPANARIPITFDTDRECIDAALSTIGLVPPGRARVLWVKNTLELEHLMVSEAYQDEVSSRPDLERVGEPRDMPFDAAGNLPKYRPVE